MKSVLQFAPLHILVLYGIGILFQYKFNTSIPTIYLFGVSLVLLIFVHFYKFKYILLGFVIFLMGVVSIQIKKSPNNIAIQQSADSKEIVCTISAVLKETKFHNRFYADILKVGVQSSGGKILVQIEKDSLQENLTIGDVVITNTILESLEPAKNPHGFDYSAFLNSNNIYEQLRLKKNTWRKLHQNIFSIRQIAYQFRENLIKSLEEKIDNKEVIAITAALILGDRHFIPQELQQEYADAGVVHILAVSGLHIGIMVLLLHFLLQPLKRFRQGKLLEFVIIISFLWSYAFVAGLSPSVVRAVTMFSFVSLGLILKNKTNVYHALITSALLLLLFYPYFLFSLGFKMSYLAVISIVIVQPKLVGFWKPKYKITKYFWNLITVSIAAQIGLMPLSLYYFHQFSSLFVLSNLVIIPCLGTILILGFVTLLLSVAQMEFSWFLELYTTIVDLLNAFIGFISQQENWIFREIHFSIFQLWAFYLLLIAGVCLLIKTNIKYLYFFLSTMLLVQSVFMYEFLKKEQLCELVIFHQYKTSLVSTIKNGECDVYGNKNKYSNKIIKEYSTGVRVSVSKEVDELPSVFKMKSSLIFVIDSLGVYKIPNAKNEILFLSDSPKINLERCIDYVQPKLIIADGSNYPSLKKKWKDTCENLNISFYDTSQKGAFILRD